MKDPLVGIDMPGDSVVTMRQLNALLSVVNVLQAFAIVQDHQEGGGLPGRRELDGGVEAAAHATLVNALGRIDKLLAEDDRWNLQEAAEAAKIRGMLAASGGQPIPGRLPAANPAASQRKFGLS